MSMQAEAIKSDDRDVSTSSLKTELIAVKQDLKCAEERVDELKGWLSEIEESGGVPWLDDHVRVLAKVRTALYAGRYDEGRAGLERVLDDLDNAWRTLA